MGDKMTDINIIKETLKSIIESGKKKFVILPYGKLGKFVQRELREQYGIQEEMCLDSAGGGKNTEGAIKMSEVTWSVFEDDCYFLLVSAREQIRQELTKSLLDHQIGKNRIIDIYAEENFNVKFTDVKLDFLCVGFQKCGTTSLDFALKENRYIYTPPEKETLYFKWYKNFSNSGEMFAKSFPEEKCRGKVVGGIEPSFYNNAQQVYQCFGDKIKILFMVRNPIESTDSFFRMIMREVVDESNLTYYKLYEKVSPIMFDAWVKDNEHLYSEFRYMNYIEEYLRYFKAENIKVIIFEDFLHDTRKVMDEIQQFIGLNNNLCKTYASVPHENIGTLVSKNYACAMVNHALNNKINEIRSEGSQLMEEVKEIKSQMGIFTREPYQESMLRETFERLNAYFENSNLRLEKFLNRKMNWSQE